MYKKSILILTVLLFCQCVFAQYNEERDTFNKSKKSIVLSTGIHMKYIEMGNPNGKPVLLLHGYAGTSRSFQNLINWIIAYDSRLRIIAPDLRGHGGSSLPISNEVYSGFLLEDFETDLLDFMAQKKMDNTVLVGHSMGSLLAQELALKHPDKVRSLVLISPFTGTMKSGNIQKSSLEDLINGTWHEELTARYGEHWKERSYFLHPEELGIKSMDLLGKAWVSEGHAPQYLLNAINTETIHTSMGTWFGVLNGLGDIDNGELLSLLKTPTLVLHSENDSVFPAKKNEASLRLICEEAFFRSGTPIYYKSYRSHEGDISKIGHNLHWGIPKRIARDIVNFIKTGKPVTALKKNSEPTGSGLQWLSARIQFWGIKI